MSEAWPVYLLAAVVVGLGALCVWLWRARRSDLDRVSALQAEVVDAAEHAAFGKRISQRAVPAEFAELGTSINSLFDALHDKEQALYQRESLFQDLANTMPEVVLVHRDRVVFANSAAASLLGVVLC